MDATRIKLVISDLHLSRGKWLKNGKRNPLEDFHQDERFHEFLTYYSTGTYSDMGVELIINGDFFDPLAVIPISEIKKKLATSEYPLEVEETAAIQKFSTILAGHPIVVTALQEFLARGKKIVFRWGNHDAALLWPGVQKLLRERLQPQEPSQLEFQQKPYIFDRICIEHGHQYEVINHFDEEHMFIKSKTQQGEKLIQNLPFGSFFVLGFLNRVKLQRSYINQVQPLRLYIRLSLLLDPLFFIVKGLAVSWFFIKMRFITHPMRFTRFKKTCLLLMEIFRRSSLEKIAEERFQTHPDLPYDTLIMGHNHQARMRIFPSGKQYVNTGTWIPITSLSMHTLGRQILRTYALIEYKNGNALTSLKVWHGNPLLIEDFF